MKRSTMRLTIGRSRPPQKCQKTTCSRDSGGDGSGQRRALGEIEDECAVEALVPMFEQEEAGLRAATAWALGEIKGQRAVYTLALVLKSDPGVAPRRAAVKALSAIISPTASTPSSGSLATTI